MHLQVLYQSLGSPPSPPPPDLKPEMGEKQVNAAYNMLYIPWMVILGDHDIKKTLSKNSFLSCPG